MSDTGQFQRTLSAARVGHPHGGSTFGDMGHNTLLKAGVTPMFARNRVRGGVIAITGEGHRGAMTNYPEGWYWGCFSEDLGRKQVIPVTRMNHRYALMRTASGRPSMLSAACRHMGADLSRAGKVVGERIVCGYHAWEFGVSGACEVMPDVDRIPKAARQRTLPVIEEAGAIWFWWGAGPPEPFVDVAALRDNKKFITLRGEVHVGQSGPLPIVEHIADIYHFPHNHQSRGSLEYHFLVNEGRRLEFQMRPAGHRGKLQGFFSPWAFTEMAGPCTGFIRTQSGPEVDRENAMLTIVLGHSPVHDQETLFSWRIFVRRFAGLYGWPFDRVLAQIMWLIIRKNVHKDLEVLKWMDPPERSLWVKPDGASVREFRSYYYRNMSQQDSTMSE